MHRAAQAEHIEVQKRRNHGTLSAQLHNVKSSLLVVSILHVRFSVPAAEPLDPSEPPLHPPAVTKGKQLTKMTISEETEREGGGFYRAQQRTHDASKVPGFN